MTLGQRISTNRKQLGIPQEELGARLGVSRQAVSKWENDLTVPDMTNLLGLAREFGISVAELTETPVETPFQKSPTESSGTSTGRDSPASPPPRWRGGVIFVAVLMCVGLFLVLSFSRVEKAPDSDSASDGIAAPEKPRVPDNSDRQEPVDTTQQVYIAWNQLVTGETLSAEERYTCRSQVFSGLPDMDWREFGKLGTTDALATSEAFAQWLREQTFSDSELFWVQAGLCADGLDGAYSENYDSLLASAMFRNPVGYARQLPRAAEYDEAVGQHILHATAYGADYYTAECALVVDALDEVIDTSALTESENDWAKLLRYYLAHPDSRDYADYPNTPAGFTTPN